MNLGHKEGFVGVNITEASDDFLVQNNSFDGGTRMVLETLVKIRGGHIPWFGSEAFDEGVIVNFVGGDNLDKTEFALVVKVEMVVVGLGFIVKIWIYG